MKTYYRLLLFVFFGAFFASCSTDVELYTDYKDVAIIYGLLDHQADTNFIKITRAFCGTNDDPINAHEVALIADSSNYPGKLDARLVELKSTIGSQYEPTGRELVLDTMTIHDKEEGTFYSPDQKVYYTTEQLNASSTSIVSLWLSPMATRSLHKPQWSAMRSSSFCRIVLIFSWRTPIGWEGLFSRLRVWLQCTISRCSSTIASSWLDRK